MGFVKFYLDISMKLDKSEVGVSQGKFNWESLKAIGKHQEMPCLSRPLPLGSNAKGT